jgi:hypothetical protein
MRPQPTFQLIATEARAPARQFEMRQISAFHHLPNERRRNPEQLAGIRDAQQQRRACSVEQLEVVLEIEPLEVVCGVAERPDDDDELAWSGSRDRRSCRAWRPPGSVGAEGETTSDEGGQTDSLPGVAEVGLFGGQAGGAVTARARRFGLMP